MKIKMYEIPIKDVFEGYVDDQENGVVAFHGKLNVRPAYQREFIYPAKERNEVINTIRKGFPLNTMYWVRTDTDDDNAFPDDYTGLLNGEFELLDGQQRTLSFCQFMDGDFSIEDVHTLYYHSMTGTEQLAFANYVLTVYVCIGNDKEKLDWFRVINIAGEKLTDQELRNAIYTGSWLSDAKRYFSKSGCPAYQIASDYLTGNTIRQDYLQTAIEWIGRRENLTIEGYMAKHRHDPDAHEIWLYFKGVIDWVQAIFPKYRKEMKGIDWGELYEIYHECSYDVPSITAKVSELYADLAVNNKKGIFTYVLDGCHETSLLQIRMFDKLTKQKVYEDQTTAAEAAGISNCPLCANGNNNNRTRIWQFDEMDADHVTAWSNGGATDISNCEMLCKSHNRSKGNA